MRAADQKMLELIDLLQSSGRIRFRQDFLDVIGLTKQNFRRVGLGLQHFSSEHIGRACEAYGVNANWIFGLEDTVFRRTKRATTGIPGQKTQSG